MGRGRIQSGRSSSFFVGLAGHDRGLFSSCCASIGCWARRIIPIGVFMLLALLLISGSARQALDLHRAALDSAFRAGQLAVIFILARLYDERKAYRFGCLLLSLALLLAIIPAILVVREPDLGPASSSGGIFLFMAYGPVMIPSSYCSSASPIVLHRGRVLDAPLGAWIILLLIILYFPARCGPGVMIGGPLGQRRGGGLAFGLSSAGCMTTRIKSAEVFLDPGRGTPTHGGYQIIQS